MNRTGRYKPNFILLLIVLMNILGQVTFLRSGLDNQIKNRYSPTATNAREYVERAEIIYREGSFSKAFGDGYRMPGYPLFIAMFYWLTNQPLLAVRYAQIILSSLVVMLSYLMLRSIVKDQLYALIGAFVFALWLPFYYYSPILYAESCSIFINAAFYFSLSKVTEEKKLSYLLLSVFLLALSVYIKPNHILLFLPLLLFCYYVMRDQGRRKRILSLAISAVFLVLLMLPWTIPVSLFNRAFIPLSTTQGVNLFVGAGFKFDTSNNEEGIHGDVAKIIGLEDREEHPLDSLQIKGMSAHELDTYYRHVAIDAWKSHPLMRGAYGFAKILHAFGFSLRDHRDFILLLHFALSLTMSVVLWRKRIYREWCLLFWGVAAIVCVQSFFFVPPQRFKTVLFDFPGILIIILGLAAFFPPPLMSRFDLSNLIHDHDEGA